MDIDRPPPIDSRQSLLDPVAHGVSVGAIKPGDLLNRVTAMNLYEPVVPVASSLKTLPRFDRGRCTLTHALILRLAAIRRSNHS